MLTSETLREIAAARLADAKALLDVDRWDGSRYLAGYAVEIVLKAKIAEFLNGGLFPETGPEFAVFPNFRTHNLERLLNLSGERAKVTLTLLADWSVVSIWNPETRYAPIGAVTQINAQTFLDSSKRLVAAI